MDSHSHSGKPAQPLLTALAALGVIYGDIGTSPLYAIRECFYGPHPVPPDPANVLGVLSLVFWSLTLIVTLKYVTFLIRADSQGEGGIFALLSLLRVKGGTMSKNLTRVVTVLALAGAALLYGDGLITPAISVLSAVEGLELLSDKLHTAVVPITCVILTGLFLIQRHGTERIGGFFGPVMLVWFVTLSILGLAQILKAPQILLAINPLCAFHTLAFHPDHAIIIIGAVVLCITGGEALYADIGHFGVPPVRLSWFAVTYPALLLNYFGQGALLLSAHAAGTAISHPFFEMVPRFLLTPVIILATLATIIASQALITGVYSLTQQAIQLGYLPRLEIIHTSASMRGQIFVPQVNFLLLVGCLVLVIAFEESGKLAAAYGLAVTLGMVISSALFFLVLTRLWKWPVWRAAPLIGLFILIELAYVAANLTKIPHGGWIPLALTALLITLMLTWHKGRAILFARMKAGALPLDLLLDDLAQGQVHRVPGTAVFMSSNSQNTPVVLLHHLKHNKALHQKVVLVSVQFSQEPLADPEKRVRMDSLGQGFYRIVIHYGFAERPNLLKDMALAPCFQETGDRPERASFYLGREILLTKGPAPLAGWRKKLFAYLSRVAWSPSAYFDLPPRQVIEIGIQVEI